MAILLGALALVLIGLGVPAQVEAQVQVEAQAQAQTRSPALSPPDTASVPQPPSLWYGTDALGRPTVRLYFFKSETCPHCNKALPFVLDLARDWSWLDLRVLEIMDRPANIELYVLMARLLKQEAGTVPAFFFCGQALFGFGAADTTGAVLRHKLRACHARLTGTPGSPPGSHALPASPPPATEAEPEAEPLPLPLIGTVDPQDVSLPLFTVLVAGMDAFNPCAFFVLLFLLSLLVHARSRLRMAIVGGVFVLISGLVYFVFMAAWLNIFLWTGELRAVTMAAGAIALALAGLNIKDFFAFRRGPSLGIPDEVKPGLFARMRRLIGVESLGAMLVATVTLAIAANTYELFCTAGFPMIFTRVLTLNQLDSATYYLYLAFYNVVYVVPLLVILGLFVATLGSRKLKESEGRALKLLSGLMMLGLGAVLLLAPGLLNDLRVAAGIAGGALLLSVGLIRFQRQRTGPRVGS